MNLSFSEVFRRVVWGVAMLSTLGVEAQNVYCVRGSASGANNGADWNNAYTSLPSTPQRGATYYVASGSYSGRSLGTPVSGTTPVTIKKATEGEHGPSTGWQATYAIGPAVFNGQIAFTTAYWIFDGVTGGGPGSWTSGHGFRVINGSGPVITVPWDAPGHHVTIRHVDIQGNGGDGDGSSSPNDGVHIANTANDMTLSYVYVHDTGRCLIFCSGDNTLIEYLYGGWFESTGGQHAEAISAWRGTPSSLTGLKVRYSIWSYIVSTGGVVYDGTAGEFYGNVFYRPSGSTFSGQCAIGTWSSSKFQNCKVINNTFIDLGGATAHGIWSGGDDNGNEFKNNLYFNTSVGGAPGGSASHNHFIGSSSYGSSATTGSGNPFVNYLNLNFALTSDTPAGDTSVAAQYRTDMYGNVGATRGAVQFGGTAGGLTVNAGPDQLVTLPSTASLAGSFINPQGGVVSLSWAKISGPGTVMFSAPSSVTSTASFSVAGTYVLRLTATAGSSSASDELTVTVQAAPDATGPSVSLTGMAEGTVVSNAVSLNATATDNTGGSGVASVTFLVDGISVGSDATAPFSISWDTRSAPNGSHTIQARAMDGAGNQTVSASVTVNVQNQPLGISFEAEQGNITVPFQMSGGAIGQTVLTDLSGGGRAVYNFVVPQEGEYLLEAVVNAPSLTENSFYLNIDGEPVDSEMIWDVLPPTSAFETRWVAWRGTGTADANEFDPKWFSLSAGQHALTIVGREPNAYVDRITVVRRPSPPSNLVVR